MLGVDTNHAAPTTDKPMQRAIPRSAQAYGDTLRRNSPNYKMVLRRMRIDSVQETNIESLAITSEE